MKIKILHGADRKWHLVNADTNQALPLNPFKSKRTAEMKRDEVQVIGANNHHRNKNVAEPLRSIINQFSETPPKAE